MRGRTCLTIRALHIALAHSLDTDACINALRYFISRRGQVAVIRSDNGNDNFVGAERELREATEELDQSRIHDAMMQKVTKWIFNPPATCHHGGVWERQICAEALTPNHLLLLKTQASEPSGVFKKEDMYA